MGEEGVEDQEDMAPEAGPPGEPSIRSDPQENAVLGVQFASKRKEGRRRTEMEEEKRGVVRPQFHSITKLLAKRTIVMTGQQPLCTKTITPK